MIMTLKNTDTMKNLILKELAVKLNGKYWEKGDKKRIYLECGHNTKKMSTSTYISEKSEGVFSVNCYINCPSQPYQWISSQQDEIIESVESQISKALKELSNPEKYNNYPYKGSVYFEVFIPLLSISEKIEMDMSISFNKDDFEEIKNKIEAECDVKKVTVSIYNDGSGSFKKKSLSDKPMNNVIFEMNNPSKKEDLTLDNSISTYIIGQMVEHSRFGIGKIISENENKVIVEFEKVGSKELLKRFTKLQEVA